MKPVVHELRLSESLSPFGVGAIADVLGESLIAPDTSWWDLKYSPVIHCERLSARIGAGELREPPTHAGRAGRDAAGLRYWRFPAWRFCERCQRLSQYSRSEKGAWTNKCDCGGFRVPMRYIAICRGGSHAQDIPWFQWAHRGNDAGVTEEVRVCKAYKELEFVQAPEHGEGLQSLRVRCRKCRRSRPLSDLVQNASLLRDGIKCLGRQPWEYDGEPCDHELVAVQRGATGNYISERVSALDIPESTPASVRMAEKISAHAFFQKVVEDSGGPQAEMVAEWISDELGVSAELVLEVARTRNEPSESPALDLKDGEWAAFVEKLESGRDDTAGALVVDGWQVSSAEPLPALGSVLSHVGQVRRVREVRTLVGFRRHSADAKLVPADLDPGRRRNPAFPAIELFGEGVFLRFAESRLAGWEALPEVQNRAAILVASREESSWAHRLEYPAPRYIALHTIAHLLIRRLAFESGYSSASLQERIYASTSRVDNTAGVFVYTAAGDAQGTLGGLVRLGRPDLLFPILLAALGDADVCSNDPVCLESDRHRAAQLNLAACHGCALVSETSCESGNRLLDRRLVLGGGGVPGLLEGVLENAQGLVG
ncbi:DUF1998 domain-containing protein [Demequina pelophila]|uniref:DUF1998 domain-containing protein n=1 Tax=Demequina pelophila TaxID=1638984 RepID=UPI0007850869|nr:DUF1998 domain-containing protein [Demequina pelophila]